MRSQMYPCSMLFALSLVLLGSGAALAGDPYSIELSETRGYAGGSATITVSLDSEDGDELAGYVLAVCHDPDLVTLEEEDIVNGAAIDADEYLFHAVDLWPDEAGWTIGAARNIGEPLPTAADHELYRVTYELLAVGDASLEFCELASFPIVTTVIEDSDLDEIVEGEGLTLVDGAIDIGEESFNFFLRGDANDDAQVGLPDVFRILNMLFQDEPVSCREACNVDQEGDIDVRDVVALLNHLYLEGPEPTQPFPTCGHAKDADGEAVAADCESSTGCE